MRHLAKEGSAVKAWLLWHFSGVLDGPCGQRCASQVGGAVVSWSGHVDSGFAELLLSEVSLWEAGLKNQGRFSADRDRYGEHVRRANKEAPLPLHLA